MTAARIAKLRQTLDRRQPDLTLLAEDTHKTHNIAALVRTCDAVGIADMHAVSQETIRKHHMISGGSHKWVGLHRHASLGDACEILREQGFRLLAAHQSRRAVDFHEVDYVLPTAIVVGSELWGVSATAAAMADEHIVIPMQGLVSSLNVSVAAALLLYEAMRQRQAAGLYDQRRLDPERYQRLLFEWAYPRIARRCRQLGRAYPSIADDGTIENNPFDPPVKTRTGHG